MFQDLEWGSLLFYKFKVTFAQVFITKPFLKLHFAKVTFLFLHFSPLSAFVLRLFPSLFLSQALVNTNSFCQGICGCVWMETETWEHWACLLLIEYAWLGLPGAVSDETRMKMLMFAELSSILADPFYLRVHLANNPYDEEWIAFRGGIPMIHPACNWFNRRTHLNQLKFVFWDELSQLLFFIWVSYLLYRNVSHQMFPLTTGYHVVNWASTV